MCNPSEEYDRFNSACAFMGFYQYRTGGNCTSLRFNVSSDDTDYMLITFDDEPTAPASLSDGPVVVAGFENGASEPTYEATYPTLLDAFQDLYGLEEGGEYPAEIA